MWSTLRAAMAVAVGAVFVGAPSVASAQLQSLGPVDQTGTGFGNVNTVLTLHDNNNESGCIGPVGVAGCVAHNLVPGASHSHLYTVGDLSGLSGSNLRLFLNFAEPGNAAMNGATLNDATLTLYSGTTPLFTTSTGSITYASTFTGMGNTGFMFGLSPTDAALFDSFLSQPGSANYTLGLSSSFSNVSGGPETWFIGTAAATVPPTTATPEPGSLALLGTGLFGLVPMVRRKLRK